MKEIKGLYHDFPHENIEVSEEPDFLIKTATELIGIELVDYVSGQNESGFSSKTG